MFFRITAVLMIFSRIVSAHAGTLPPKDNPKIEYGYPDQSIFVASVNAQNRPESPMIRLAGVLMEKAGLDWYSVAYPARRLFWNLKNGTTDFSILVKASTLQGHCIFSRAPVYSTTLRVYFIGDKPPVLDGKDLAGKKILTILGYSYGGLLKYISDPANQIVNLVAPTHQSAFSMLERKRADYVLDYESAAGDILAEHPIKDIRSHPISQLDIYLVLSKAYPDAENLMRRLENIVESLDVRGILKGGT